MKSIFVLLIIFSTSSVWANETLFNAIASVSDISSSMGGKALTSLNDLVCRTTVEPSSTHCSFKNTHGQEVSLSSDPAKELLKVLNEFEVLAYGGSGAGSSWSVLSSIECKSSIKRSTENTDDPVRLYHGCTVVLD